MMKGPRRSQKQSSRAAKNAAWFHHYYLVIDYLAKNGDINIPIDYVSHDEKGKPVEIGKWLANQFQQADDRKFSGERRFYLNQLYTSQIIEDESSEESDSEVPLKLVSDLIVNSEDDDYDYYPEPKRSGRSNARLSSSAAEETATLPKRVLRSASPAARVNTVSRKDSQGKAVSKPLRKHRAAYFRTPASPVAAEPKMTSARKKMTSAKKSFSISERMHRMSVGNEGEPKPGMNKTSKDDSADDKEALLSVRNHSDNLQTFLPTLQQSVSLVSKFESQLDMRESSSLLSGFSLLSSARTGNHGRMSSEEETSSFDISTLEQLTFTRTTEMDCEPGGELSLQSKGYVMKGVDEVASTTIGPRTSSIIASVDASAKERLPLQATMELVETERDGGSIGGASAMELEDTCISAYTPVDPHTINRAQH